MSALNPHYQLLCSTISNFVCGWILMNFLKKEGKNIKLFMIKNNLMTKRRNMREIGQIFSSNYKLISEHRKYYKMVMISCLTLANSPLLGKLHFQVHKKIVNIFMISNLNESAYFLYAFGLNNEIKCFNDFLFQRIANFIIVKLLLKWSWRQKKQKISQIKIRCVRSKKHLKKSKEMNFTQTKRHDYQNSPFY